MTPREIATELIRTRADIDQTRACLDDVSTRLDGLHQQLTRLFDALERRRRRDTRWHFVHLITNSLVFAMGTALLVLTMNR